MTQRPEKGEHGSGTANSLCITKATEMREMRGNNGTNKIKERMYTKTKCRN